MRKKFELLNIGDPFLYEDSIIMVKRELRMDGNTPVNASRADGYRPFVFFGSDVVVHTVQSNANSEGIAHEA